LTEPQDELLHREVPGVRRQILGVTPTERDDERATQGHGDPLQGFEVRVRDAPFDSAFHHAAQSAALRKLRAREPAPLTKGLDLRADPRALFAGAALSLDRQSRKLMPGMIGTCSFRGLHCLLSRRPLVHQERGHRIGVMDGFGPVDPSVIGPQSSE
jgi:hypothetical protein